MLESKIQKAILDYLNAQSSTWAVKIMQANRNGTPDILCCHRGLFVAFEVKTPTGRTSPIQEFQIAAINETGGLAAVVRSVDDVKAVLQKLR